MAWSNAAASLGIGAGVFVQTHAFAPSIAAATAAFLLLRVALAHRWTVRVAAALGTIAVAALGGGLAWLLAHVFESIPSAPIVGALLGAIGSAALPLWAYVQLARYREQSRDSLIDPVSVPSSRC